MKCLSYIAAWRFPIVAMAAFAAGCSSEQRSAEAPATPADKGADGVRAAAEPSAATRPFQLGDLIEAAEIPPFEALNQQVEWIDSPVVDPLARLREAKADEPPLASVAEALAMRNDSPEANEKIISALSVLAAPDGADVHWDATFNRALLMDLRTTNPILYQSVAEAEIVVLTAFNMFRFDWDMTPFAVPSYVESWQTSKDRLYDKVVMRSDLVWSDGKPITAHDVEFSFKLIMSSAVPVPALRTEAAELRWVKAYDDRTLVYCHKQAASTNVWHVNFPIVARHVYEQSVAEDPTLRTSAYHRQRETSPISGGPYEIVRWSRGQEIVLRRRENYYLHDGRPVRDKPYFAQMRFRIIEDGNTRLLALKSGDIDESELEAEQWQTQTAGDDFYAENTKVHGPQWLYFYIGWNLDTKKVPFFADLRVRQAMAYALNYDEMLNDLCYGLYDQCLGIWNPRAWMYPGDPAVVYRQDLDKAEDLLDAAGWVDSDADGVRDKDINGRRVPFEFSLLVGNKPDRIAICNLFRENLESIGVTCNVTPLEAAVFLERVYERNFEAEFAGWSTGADPSTVRNIFGTGQERNYVSYSNPEVDRLLRAAMQEFDRQKQAELYGKVHELIYADQPYLFLYNKHSLYGFNKKLRGYRFSPRGPFHYSPGIEAIWAVRPAAVN